MAAKLNIKSTEIDTVATILDKKKGVITGLVQINGSEYHFEVYVEDNGEPGKDVDIGIPVNEGSGSSPGCWNSYVGIGVCAGEMVTEVGIGVVAGIGKVIVGIFGG